MSVRTLVTGGSSGIGAEIVRTLAARGHEVTFTFNASAAAAAALEQECGGRARGVAVDLADAAAVEDAGDELASTGKFDNFVHSAGRSCDGLSMAGRLEDGRAAMQVNFWSAVALYGKLVRAMMAARAGRVVLIGSVTAERGNRGNALYAATKGALAAFARSAADELGARGVTINIVAPGYVDTPMMAGYGSGNALASRIPSRRYARPGEVAGLVAFLLTDEAGYINGATLVVDGGLSATLGMAH